MQVHLHLEVHMDVADVGLGFGTATGANTITNMKECVSLAAAHVCVHLFLHVRAYM